MRFSSFLPLVAVASSTREGPSGFLEVHAPERLLASNCPDYSKLYPNVTNVNLINYVCDYWPEDKWGPFPEELVGNLVDIAKDGSLTKLIAECKTWMEGNNAQEFCWRHMFDKRPQTGAPASCEGPGMDGGKPTFVWKCWMNCEQFCQDKFGEKDGYTKWYKTSCVCPKQDPSKFNRYQTATCKGGEEPYFGSCYGACPMGFEANGVFKSKCATDCSQNTNGLTKNCGLGCAKDGYQCASSIFGMIASAAEAAIGIAGAASDDEDFAKTTEAVSKMLDVTSNVVDKAMDSMSKFDTGDKTLSKMAVFGALMKNFAENFKTENGGYTQGVAAYKKAVVEMIDALKDGKDKYPDSAKDIINNATGDFKDIAGDAADVFKAYYHSFCE